MGVKCLSHDPPPLTGGLSFRVLYQVFLMYYVIAHDFEIDLPEGSDVFTSLDDARKCAQQFSSEVADTVTVLIQDADGAEIEVIKSPADS